MNFSRLNFTWNISSIQIYNLKFKPKKMKNLFFLLVSAFILSSCATPTEETAPSEETTVDSTEVESTDPTSVDSTVAPQ